MDVVALAKIWVELESRSGRPQHQREIHRLKMKEDQLIALRHFEAWQKQQTDEFDATQRARKWEYDGKMFEEMAEFQEAQRVQLRALDEGL